MINNTELQKIWKETLEEYEKDMNKDVAITIEDNKLRERLINVFNIFNKITYEIDMELTERRYGRKIYDENEDILFSYKNKCFEGIVYLFDYMAGCHVESDCVKELIESMKYFYSKLIEDAGEKEIIILSEKATDMYILIEKMFEENVKRGFKNNVLDYLFALEEQREDKELFIKNYDALNYIYNKIADTRKIPPRLRKKIVLDNIT